MKKITFIILSIITIFSLVGCVKDIEGETSFVDHAGNEIVIDSPKTRIVSGYYSTTTLCLALGLEDNLVAIEKKADTRELYKQAAPEIINLPQVSTKKDINVEETLKTNPDLVILPLSLKDSRDKFVSVGITTIVVNPETVEELNETVEMIGIATGHETEANSFIDYNSNKLEEITKLTKNVQNRPSVYLSSSSSYLSTAPNEYYQTKMIEMAGGSSVSKNLSGNGWVKIEKEQLISYQPEYYFYVYDAEYTKEDIYKELGDTIPATKNNKVYRIPSKLENWDATGASSTLGVLWMTSILHSDLYSHEEMLDDVNYFYQTFFGFTPNSDIFGE